MPNYRNKNKHRRNKNRNKNNNNNQNKNQKATEEVEEGPPPPLKTPKANAATALQHERQATGNVSKESASGTATQCSDAATNANESAAALSGAETCATATANATALPSNDTVCQRASSQTELPHGVATTSNGTAAKADQKDARLLEKQQQASTDSEMGEQNSKLAPQPPSAQSTAAEPRELEMQPMRQAPRGKVVVHRIVQQPEAQPKPQPEPKQLPHTTPSADRQAAQEQIKVIIHRVLVEQQSAESAESVESAAKEVTESSGILIQEVSDASLSDYNENPPVVSEAESEPETVSSPTRREHTEPAQILSIQTMPLGVYSDEDEGSPLSPPEDELKQRRVQTRAALEAHFRPQFLSPRYLDSIKEENSDMSDARSDCSDQATLAAAAAAIICGENHDSDAKAKRANAIFPKSNLDFSKKHKHGSLPKAPPLLPGAIHEEPPMAIVVETKFVDQLSAAESCSRVDSVLAPESEAAEVVYINSSASSSASDLRDLDQDESDAESRFTVDLDTDASEIIARPIDGYEDDDEACDSSRERTPVNRTSASPESEVSEFKQSNATKTDKLTDTDTDTDTPATDQRTAVSPSLSSGPQAEQMPPNAQLSSSVEQHLSSFALLSSGSGAPTACCGSESAALAQSSAVAAASTSTAENPKSSNSNSLRAEHFVRPGVLSESSKMNNVREYLNSNGGIASASATALASTSPSATNSTSNAYGTCADPVFPCTVQTTQSTRGSPSPPPVPPLPQHTDTPTAHEQHRNEQPPPSTAYTMPTKALLVRQESGDSHCSDSTNNSQCTAINVGASSLSDFDVTSPISEKFEQWPNLPAQPTAALDSADGGDAPIKKLRLLCTETLASMPYGEDVLEELATVAQNIGETRASSKAQQGKDTPDNMPYPLPHLPHIDELQLSLVKNNAAASGLTQGQQQLHSPSPPPVPAPSSEHTSAWLALPTEADPKLLVCLSPSQQLYMSAQQPTAGNQPDQLLDAHQKFVERRGYHEYSAEQLEEQRILDTAAYMKKLRKSLTPTPPPIPPPPVPAKSSETAAKAQIQAKAAAAAATAKTTSDYGMSFRNANEQTAPCSASSSNSNADGEANKHRLLAIIHDTAQTPPKTSSLENSSRQPTTSERGGPLQAAAAPAAATAVDSMQSGAIEQRSSWVGSSLSAQNATKVDSSANKFPDAAASMQGIESELGKMFPAMGGSNIFDKGQRRFSNIESSSMEPLNMQPKRYSTIETSSYETKKRTENGQVVYDYSTSKRESHKGADDKSFASTPLQFPSREAKSAAAKDQNEGKTTTTSATTQAAATPTATTHAEEIMSAFKLKTENSTLPAANNSQPAADNAEAKSSAAAEAQQRESLRRDFIKNRQMSENFALNKDISGTYEEFRQRAKAAAEAIPATGAATPATAPAATASNGTADEPRKSVFHFDREKLFKDFDELSNQLRMELESGRSKRLQSEKAASLFDLSRMPTDFRHEFTQLKQKRHEHMQELEQEIERSMRSRQLRHASKPRTNDAEQHTLTTVPHTYDIPIRLEGNGNVSAPRIHQIPVQLEAPYKVSQPATPQHMNYDNSERFRRAESMFDITDNAAQCGRPRSISMNNGDQQSTDDWSRYASDLGSSENIAKPFAREVEICYQRFRPNAIRAPRLSVSTNVLSHSQCFDSHNAYGARRTYAPMLSQAPQKSRPQYLSCSSMIERDPNPTYITTTSRRGVSPAPQVPPSPSADTQGSYYAERHQRRASLPREIQEQQFKHILSKEEELRAEVERLQNERMRLLDEMAGGQPMQVPQRPIREHYRPPTRLPTLSEDEVFRQQMAEEWLSKVAEREDRRLHKIIKISKAHEDEAFQQLAHSGTAKSNISDEFLNRVKERRSKLAMPADSDWESGAESQPLGQGQTSESEEPPAVKVIDGKSEADFKHLPKHLREFARFANRQSEQIDGGHRELHEEEERRQEASGNTVSSAIKKSSMLKTVKISAPLYPAANGTAKHNSIPVNTATPTPTSASASTSTAYAQDRRCQTAVKQNCYQSAQQLRQHRTVPYPTLSNSCNSKTHRPEESMLLAMGAPASHSCAALPPLNTKPFKRTRFLQTSAATPTNAAVHNRRSWSENDLLKEIDRELKLAKGFLFADEQAQSSIMFVPKFKAKAPPGTGTWTPKSQTPTSSINDFSEEPALQPYANTAPTPPPPPSHLIWTPQPSPTTARKEFRPVRFESPTLPRRYVLQQNSASTSALPPWSDSNNDQVSVTTPSPRSINSCTNLSTTTTIGSSSINPYEPQHDPIEFQRHCAPSASVSDKIRTFERSASASELSRPFARRQQDASRPHYRPNDVIYKVKHEYMSEPETENDRPKKMAQLGRRQYDGIGPVTNDGMPIILRSEVKEPHQHEWYKRLYQTIHKQKNGDDYVIRYKCPRGRHQYKTSGYQSEPEPNYDSDYSIVKYRTLDRRRVQPVSSISNVRSETKSHQNDKVYGTMPNPIKSGQNSYKNQPGRIEDYITGRSSVSEKEHKEWWDEVMDIFNGWLRENTLVPRIYIEFVNDDHLEQTKLSPHYTEGNLSRALAKESGYASDSNLVFRKKEAPPGSALSPVEQKQAYKSLQAGGQPPLFGFRKPAPEKQRGFMQQFEYYRITPTLTKIRVSRKEVAAQQKHKRDTKVESAAKMCTPFPRSMPSFIPLSAKKDAPSVPPVPPHRQSSCSRAAITANAVDRLSKATTSKIATRHKRCFQSPDSAASTANKYATITLRKHAQPEAISRSKSAGAVSSLLHTHVSSKHSTTTTTRSRSPACEQINTARLQQHTRLRSLSPQRRQPRVECIRKSSRSPVAFGRSISKERTFAEEKKRLENTLPLNRASFEASTNILRDPSLRSPQAVKQAVRSYATCPAHVRSKSVPRFVPALHSYRPTTVSTTMRHSICYPQVRPTNMVDYAPKPIPKSVSCTKLQTPRQSDRSSSTRQAAKTVRPTQNLVRTNSTFSVESSATRVLVPRSRPLASSSTKVSSKVKMPSTEKTPKVKAPASTKAIRSSKSDSNVCRKPAAAAPKQLVKVDASTVTDQPLSVQQLRCSLLALDDESLYESVHDKAIFWNDFNAQQAQPQQTSAHYNCKCESQHKSRSFSPARQQHVSRVYLEEVRPSDAEQTSEFGENNCIEDLVWQYELKSKHEAPHSRAKSPSAYGSAAARADSPAATITNTNTLGNGRKFSPTREVRVPQTPRNLRSPSRRKIDSCRSSLKSDTQKVIRASSLSSADDRSKRGLYQCGDLAHSATSLTCLERHSPNCRYRSNCERFRDLNRFYSTLERVGQLERATSLTNFKPIRKDSELLHFDEWRKIRLHERAEKELNYLVHKLKQDQREKDMVFRPKDVEDVKWRQENDFGLHAKEKSVEDLRVSFERKGLFQDFEQERDKNRNYYRPYWRRNTVADLASSLEVKLQPEHATLSLQQQPLEGSAVSTEYHLSNHVVSTLSKEQLKKISRQLNEIYASNSQSGNEGTVPEEFVVTVERASKPTTMTNNLKVRCNSSITKDDLLGTVTRKKELLSNAQAVRHKREPQLESGSTEAKARGMREHSPVLLARETRGATAAKNAEETLKRPPKVPLPPDSAALHKDGDKGKELEQPACASKQVNTMSAQHAAADTEEAHSQSISRDAADNISQKIQYFEDRQFEQTPKTIYHAREDSSPDENEIMHLIEENMKSRAQERLQQHKQLSNSLTDLKDIFGERHTSRVNFYIHSPTPTPTPPQPPPPDDSEQAQSMHVMELSRTSDYELDNFSPHSSIEMFDVYYRSRSVSPQSQTSSHLQRVHTGEVQKLRQRFESLECQKGTNPFFGISSLRKVRSDPELKPLSSASKDACRSTLNGDPFGDVSSVTHTFEMRNSCSERGRRRKRPAISPPTSERIRNRLMPHIDIISKTAALKQHAQRKCPSRSLSPARSHSSNSGIVERIRNRYETSNSPTPSSRQLTFSNPIMSDLNAIPQHLTADWIAHKYPSPERTTRVPRKPNSRIRSSSNSPPRPPKSLSHQKCALSAPNDDIFANQKFDPKMHQPKARYVPDGAEMSECKKRSSHPAGASFEDYYRKSVAVTFQDLNILSPVPVLPELPRKVAISFDQTDASAEAPNRYFESDVNIHFKTPVRHEYKHPVPEEELAMRQAEQMQRLYQEERRRKYLQELHDMNSRRHTDNFTPTQKSPIPLNRYDDFPSDLAPKSPNVANSRKAVARALYNFQGQSARELSLRKGDVIYIRRQVDKNWYEGEHNAMIGLLPVNYVEIINKDSVRPQPKKPSEGQARAKYSFQAQSGVELSLNKGELVTLTRRVDDNWFEGKIANRKGIFPVSYVEVLTDIGSAEIASKTTITEHSTTNLRPSLDTLRTNINNEFNLITQNGHQPPNGILKETRSLHKTDALHVDTSSQPLTYRALYKYRPQNADELELLEGDLVHVLEKCDDGWFVGTSQRTGCFGTFPGNYVERV